MNWPTQAAVLAGKSPYGNPRGPSGSTASPRWERENLVQVVPLWPMNMGTIKISSFRLHGHCAPSFRRIMAKLQEEAGTIETLRHWGLTKYAGAYNYRPMRGLSTLSMHAYGCAIDFDAENNGLHDKTPRFAKFPEVRKIFADAGWTWGGDWNGNDSSADERRPDGMHWQAADV